MCWLFQCIEEMYLLKLTQHVKIEPPLHPLTNPSYGPDYTH